MVPRIPDKNATETTTSTTANTTATLSPTTTTSATTTTHEMKIDTVSRNVAENGEHHDHPHPHDHDHGWIRSLLQEGSSSSSAEQEVDFEQNPTVLSRLILNRKFLSGIKRLRIYPEEAKIWICSRKRPPMEQRRRNSWPDDPTLHDNTALSQSEYSLRQLPLHMACSSLVQISEPSLREELERLITNLVVMYPQACSKRDLDRRLPLHQVVRLNASPDTVSVLLMAYPQAAGERDRYGNLPQGLFLHRNRKGSSDNDNDNNDAKQISDLLQRGIVFWEQARSEAMLRMKMDLRPSSRESAYSTQVLQTSMRSLSDASGHDNSHSSSSSSAASSAHDQNANAHVTEKNESSSASNVNVNNVNKVGPPPVLLLSQAEKRTVHFEQLLEEMYERNYALAEVVKTLTREKQETQAKLDQWTGTTTGRTNVDVDVADIITYKLLDEKSDLQKKLSRLGIVLRDMGLDESGHHMDYYSSSSLSNEPMELISIMGMDPERPTALTNYLDNKVTSLQMENDALEDKNDDYRRRVEDLQAQVWNLELVVVTPPLPPVNDNDDEESLSVSLRDARSSTPSSSARNERETSDNERLLALKVLELQKQLDTLQNNKSQEIVAGTAAAADGQQQQQHSPVKRPSMDLESQLKIIDTLSGHTSDLIDMEPELDSHGTPETMPSVANTAATGEVLNNITSRHSGSSKSESGKSVSSWGLLSLSQCPTKLSKKQQAQHKNFTPMPSLPQGHNSFASFHASFHSSFHDSMGSFAETADTDDLDELFKSAADFYDGYMSEANVFDGHKSAANFGSSNKPSKPRRRRARRFSDGGASPALQALKIANDARNKPESDPDPLVATARLLAAEEEVTVIMQDVEEKMGTELSNELVVALREAALQQAAREIDPAFTTENTFHVFHAVAESIIEYKLIDEAEKIYGEPIPTEIVNVLRAASMVLVETSQRGISAMENMKQKLKEELLDALIDTAERQLHKTLPYDLTVALKNAGMSFDSLLTEQEDDAIHIDFQEMDKMVKEAQRLYGKPFSQEILVALRRALFVLQSRLEGTDIGGDHPEQTPHPRKERNQKKKGRGKKKTSKTEHDASNSQAKRTNAMNSSAPALFASGSNAYSKNIDRKKGSRSIDGKSFPSIFEESYRDDAKTDDQTEARSLTTHDSTTDGSLDIANVFPVLKDNKSSALESKLNSINEASKSQEIDASRSSLSPGRARRGGRRPSVEGGDNPSAMYKRARARSRSPSDELGALYQSAAIARNESPSPAVRQEGGDDLSNLLRRASATRGQIPAPDLSCLVSDDEDDDSAQGDNVEKLKQGGGSSFSSKSNSNPSLVQTSGSSLQSAESESRSKVPKSNSRSEGGRKSGFQPLKSISDSRGGKDRDEPPSTVARKKRSSASEFMNSLADFGEVNDDDFDLKELYKNAVSTLSAYSSPEIEVRKQLDSGAQEPPEPQAQVIEEVTTESEDEDEDDESETETDLGGSNDDMKSTDFSKASEVSMDILAVFQKESEPSDLEKKLTSLQKKASHSAPSLASSASETAHRQEQAAPSAGRRPPPRRGVRQAKSGDLDLFASSIAATSRRGNLRAAKSADLTLMAQSAVSMPTRGNLKPTRNGESFVSLASSTATDDLDALFKQAVQVDSAPSARMSSASNLNQDSLLASTHHMPNRSGEAALTTIITDTEETYGIEIPPDLVQALRKAAIGPFPDVPLLTIVKALHDDIIIEEAERYYGQPIPNDLIAAVRSVSLPPGVSIDKLVSPEDGVSSSGQSRKSSREISYNSFGDDASQDVDENIKPKSAKFTPPESSGQFTPLAQPSLEFNHTPVPPPKAGDDEEITMNMLEDEDSHSDRAWPRHASMPPLAGSKASQSEEESLHSENSWGKLSLSGSPAIKVRKHNEELKNHARGADPKSTRGASADQFMNSLADFGARTDDHRDLYNHDVDALDSYTPADAERGRLEDEARKQLSRKKSLESPLEAVMETSADSFGSIGSVDSVDAGAITTVPRPQILESCIEVSPQEFELDMLLDVMEEEIGRAIPCEVDMALRKSSRSMDESLDFVAAVNTQLDSTAFGTHLPLERLDVLYQEAAIFLGQKISPALLAALQRASDSLYKTPSIRSRLGSKAPDNHGGTKQKGRRRHRREHKTSTESQQKYRLQKKSTVVVSYDEETHAPLNDSESWGGATTGVQSRVAPLQNKSNHSIDTFFNEGFNGSTDDLGEMYRAANAASQQENKSCHSAESFFLEGHNKPPTNKEADEAPLKNGHVSTPKKKERTFSAPGRSKSGNSVDSLLGAAHLRKTDDLGEMFKAAYNESPRMQPTPPQSEESPPRVPSFKVPFSSDAKSKEPDPLLQQQLSPPVPSFDSPVRNKAPPKEVGTTPDREELMSRTESGRFMFREELMTRTDSGRFMPDLSPVTAASMGTDGGSFSKLDKAVFMEASRARLSALSTPIPDLDVDMEGKQKEDNAPNQDMPSFELPSLEAIPYEYDQHDDELGASTGELSAFSPNASAELNAIILETQAQFGMELPPELVEALKGTSIDSLVTDGDSLSLAMSEVSSLMMQSRMLDGNAEGLESNNLVMALRKKFSDTGDSASCSLALLDLEEDLVTLVHRTKHDYGEDVPPNTVFALRKTAFEILSTQESSSRSCFQGEQFIHTLRRAGEIQGQPIPPILLSALLRASEGTAPPIHNNERRIETEATSEQADQNGSGYFSAVSESEYSMALENIGSDVAENIIHEVANVHGEVPEELIENLYGDGDPPKDESLLELAWVGDDSAGPNNGSTPLEYSSSTIASSITYNSNYFHLEQKPEAAPPAMNTDAIQQAEFKYFVDEVVKEYGKQLAPEFVHALRSSSVGSDLTFESNSNAIISQTEKIYGRSFSGDLTDALQRASVNASKSLAGSRQSSLSSASSMDNSQSSQSDWTVNDEVELAGLLVEQDDTSQVQPSSGAQNSAPTVAVIKNHGTSLLLGVKKIYRKKVPLELSYVLSRSTALPNAMNTDQEIDIILVECEEMTGKRLPADLVVALREASVTIRTPNSSTRSRRSRLARQTSGSFRSTSRSSGMPSIQESSNDDFEEPLHDEPDDTGQSTITSTDSSLGMNSILSELEEHTPKATKDQQDSLGKAPAEKNSSKQLSAYVLPVPGINTDRSDEDLEQIRPPTSPLKRTPSDKSELSEDVSITLDEAQKNKSQDMAASSPRTEGNNSTASKNSSFSPGESPGFNNSTATALMSNTTEKKSYSTAEMKKKAWAPMLAQIAPVELDGPQVPSEPRSASPVRRGSNHSGGSGGSGGSTDREKEAAHISSSTEMTPASGGAGANRSSSNRESRIPLTPGKKEKFGMKKTAPPAGIESDDLADIFREAAKRSSGR
jgi:hypothetical protein